MSATPDRPAQRSSRRDLRTQCALFLVFFALYASGINGRVDVGDSTHYALIRSMGDYGRFNLGEYAGYTFKIDVSYREGKWYSDKAPGVCFMSLPFHLAGKAVAHALGRHDQEVPLSFVLLEGGGQECPPARGEDYPLSRDVGSCTIRVMELCICPSEMRAMNCAPTLACKNAM